MSLSRPAFHALLNGSAAVLLAVGLAAIRRKRAKLHRFSMGAAFLLSTVFLGSYLDYHARVGTTRFHGSQGIRTFYLAVLTSHTLLAMAVVPLVLTTLGLAFRGKWDRHRRWARWTWPTWTYVCVTGVAIYFFLAYGQS